MKPILDGALKICSEQHNGMIHKYKGESIDQV